MELSGLGTRRPQADVLAGWGGNPTYEGASAAAAANERTRKYQQPCFNKGLGTQLDNRGPSDAPLRLVIPSWMTGEDKEETRTSQFEEKRLSAQTKAGKLSEATLEQIQTETAMGFSAIEAPSNSSKSIYTPLASSAYTQEVDVTLLSANEILMKSSGGGSGAEDTGNANVLSKQQVTSTPQTTPEKPDRSPTNEAGSAESKDKDVKTMRNTARDSCRAAVAKACGKLAKEAEKATTLMADGDMLPDPSFFQNLQERVKAALLLEGKQWKTVEVTTVEAGEADKEAKVMLCGFVGSLYWSSGLSFCCF